MKILPILSCLTVSAIISGCSTLTGEGTSQNLSVFTYKSDNELLNGATCELTNDEGSWTAVTPTSTMVHRSNKDLLVRCTKDGYSDGLANVVSDTKANMWGNIIFGGGVGALIDHNNGSAYSYPNTVKITMGQSKVIKQGTEDEAEAEAEPSQDSSS
ncbi:hypothetical protein [Amphritea pacifica]|uniref:Lipoprotein n=1 Tax=Amphritea pacifica TaxID=2811233 RepID=A0ABS2W716_9GAMM|nr:hypothetical protein [Amphritea pacifica]MBN0987202.1 hypothetical protein [Amphritea pacifica]MBN1008932.1 hypothetical protein [Amphritea pacifica]